MLCTHSFYLFIYLFISIKSWRYHQIPPHTDFLVLFILTKFVEYIMMLIMGNIIILFAL